MGYYEENPERKKEKDHRNPPRESFGLSLSILGTAGRLQTSDTV
jgi:hypothetical protein